MLKPKCFKEELVFNVTNIPKDKPQIKQILDTDISSEVNNISLVNTHKGISNEGRYKSGVEVYVNLKIREKINYVGYDFPEKVHTIYQEHLNNISVVLPNEINGVPTEKLLNKNNLYIDSFVEGKVTKLISPSSIYKYTMLFLEVKHTI